MNILFLTLIDIQSIEERNIYTDLLREFRERGSHVYIASPSERRTGEKTRLISENGVTILKIKTGNLQKSGYIEKGISICLIETQFIRGIRRYYTGVRFDLVLYSTPPITFYGPIRYIKQRDNAFTYLLLKDIFPQNAVDLGVLGHKGPGHWLCAYFTKKEKRMSNICYLTIPLSAGKRQRCAPIRLRHPQELGRTNRKEDIYGKHMGCRRIRTYSYMEETWVSRRGFRFSWNV